MTADELKAIEERANAATKGPWTIETRASQYFPDNKYPDGQRITQEQAIADDDHILGGDIKGPKWCSRSTFQVRDAWFIAHTRDDIPLLISEVHRLRRLIFDYGGNPD